MCFTMLRKAGSAIEPCCRGNSVHPHAASLSPLAERHPPTHRARGACETARVRWRSVWL